MKPSESALVLVDVQHDFLARPGLSPDRDLLVARVATLLVGWRALGMPVVHVQTRIRADGADRMPHWREQQVAACVEGTPGAEAPEPLRALPGELVVTKQFYRGFTDPAVDPWLRERDVSRVVVCGLYTHACVRETVLDAYEGGYEVWVASDAVATPEPLHGTLTRAWLETRAACFRPSVSVLAELAGTDEPTPGRADGATRYPVAVVAGAALVADGHPLVQHRDPCASDRVLSEVPLGGAAEVRAAAETAAAARGAWAAMPPEARAGRLDAWAEVLEARADELADLIATEVAKPSAAADDEVRRAVGHVRTSAALVRGDATTAREVVSGVAVRYHPMGVVGIVMPWNNPLALPVGKIAPALGFGNGVVFKPAPEGAGTALALLDSLRAAGVDPALVNVVMGAAEAAEAIVDEPLIDAVAVTGSVATGRALTARCGVRGKPLQAELGGNNAVIVLADADLDAIVPPLVQGAYSYSGQRCTAIRRFVVEDSVAARFEELVCAEIARLSVGDPRDPTSAVGPLISAAARDRVADVVARARAEGARLVCGGTAPEGFEHGAWYAPTFLADVEPGHAVAREETFGPVTVLLTVSGIDEALDVGNAVEQGLVMAVCTADDDARRRVLAEARAGILQVGPGPLPVHPDAPFGGWKASGFGPPEHGEWDATFATRPQAVYGAATP